MSFSGQQNRKLTLDVAVALRRARQKRLPIVEAGDPVLRMQTQPYNGQISGKVFRRLIDVMHTTMLEAPGVGLAAPQIGLPLAFAVVEDHIPGSPQEAAALGSSSSLKDIDIDEDMEQAGQNDPREFGEFPFHVIINPHYEPLNNKTVSFYEGCLSLPGIEAVRKRWLDIHATWQSEDGKTHEKDLHGWPARIFQHETDHLSGELYIDKCEIRSLSTDDNLDEYWYDPSPEAAAEALKFSLD